MTPPKNGLLSGMLITQVAAGLAIGAGLLLPVDAIFGAAPSRTLLDGFAVSVALMGLHKLESYLEREFDQCPVYLTEVRKWAQDVGRAGFQLFVGTFLAAMLLLALALRGPPWALLLISIWFGQSLHELHHLGKTLARRRYYPGMLSALLFTAFNDVWLFPRWFASLHGVPAVAATAYYALQPIVLLAFYREDRRWWSAFARATQTEASAGPML